MRYLARDPEMRPALYSGTAMAAVRHMRLRVEDGALVLTDATGATRVLVPAGAPVRTLLVTKAQERRVARLQQLSLQGALAVVVDGALVAFVRLRDFQAPHAEGQFAFDSCGVQAVCAALGTPLEPASDAEVAGWGRRGVRAAMVSPVPHRPWPGRWATAVLSVLLFWAFLAWPLDGTVLAFAVTLPGLVLQTVVVRRYLRMRGLANEGLETPHPEVPGAVAVAPVTAWRRPQWFVDSRIYLSPDEIVLRYGLTEGRSPGPARGAVVSAYRNPKWTALVGPDAVPVFLLPNLLWIATPEAEQALDAALATIGLHPVPMPGDPPTPEELAWWEPHPRLAYPPLPWLVGNATIGTPWMAGLSSAAFVVSGVITATWQPVVGAVLVLWSATLLVAVCRDGLRRARINRPLRRWVD